MNLIVAMTGASGALATKLLVEKSQWPVTLVASRMGRVVYEQEAGPFRELEALAAEIWKEGDLTAPIASGSPRLFRSHGRGEAIRSRGRSL